MKSSLDRILGYATPITLRVFALSCLGELIKHVKYHVISMYIRLEVISEGSFCAIAPNYQVQREDTMRERERNGKSFNSCTFIKRCLENMMEVTRAVGY